jgi:osmotically-inducible protein OsmY
MNIPRIFLTTALLSFCLSGCIPLFVGGVGTAGVVASQERSTGHAIDDASIRIAINDLYLEQDTHDLFRNVDIHVQEGRVLLLGDVNKPQTAIEAVRLAWKPQGVREVINEIQVNDKSGITDYARDTWISAQVRSKLLFEKGVRSVNYTVQTVNSVVYLMGIAQDQKELDKATYLASTTSYVKQVISHVILKDDPRRK